MTDPDRDPESRKNDTPAKPGPAAPTPSQGAEPDLRDEVTAALIRRARTDDRDALGELIIRLGPWIEGLVCSEWHRTRGSYTKEDVEATLLEQVVQKIGSFEGMERPQLKAWIRTLCQNKVTDILRRITSQMRDDLREERLSTGMEVPQRGDSPATAHQRETEVAGLLAALDRLEEADRWIVEEHDLRGVALKIIADRLQISYETAKKRLQRARLKLRKEMNDLGHDGEGPSGA